jgi:hypothetical protein
MIRSDVIQDAMSDHAVLAPFHDRAEEFGERCWRINGELFDVIYWDTGNGWAVMQHVIIHGPVSADPDDHIAHLAPGVPTGDTYRVLARFFAAIASDMVAAG